MWDDLINYFTDERLVVLSRVLFVLVFGYVCARVIVFLLMRLLKPRISAHASMLVRKGCLYGLLTLVFVTALQQMGFDLTILLGAAGILTVAIGFAAHTSASNLISGLFLIGERPFVVGDVIKVADVTGEVLTIDLLSVHLRTFDNLWVRIPNETLVKSTITNLTQFPIRRVDIKVGVAYGEDLQRVRRVLFDIADRNPLCLEEPEPVFVFLEYGDSSLNLQFNVWARRENWFKLKTDIQLEIKRVFDAEGIEIPFPQRTLSTKGVLPVHLVSQGDGATTEKRVADLESEPL